MKKKPFIIFLLLPIVFTFICFISQLLKNEGALQVSKPHAELHIATLTPRPSVSSSQSWHYFARYRLRSCCYYS